VAPNNRYLSRARCSRKRARKTRKTSDAWFPRDNSARFVIRNCLDSDQRGTDSRDHGRDNIYTVGVLVRRFFRRHISGTDKNDDFETNARATDSSLLYDVYMYIIQSDSGKTKRFCVFVFVPTMYMAFAHTNITSFSLRTTTSGVDKFRRHTRAAVI